MLTKTRMEIHGATAQNIEELAALFNDYRIFYGYEGDLSSTEKFLRERISNSDSVIFIAKSEDNTVAGFTQLYPLFSSTRMKRLWLLNDLYVKPEFRGQKISVMLIDKSKQLAMETQSAGL